MLEYRIGNRKVSERQFFENLNRQGLDLAFQELEKRAYGAAASIVDPVSGKHAVVFVYRCGDKGVAIRTTGSPAFSRELEKRLGADPGMISSMKEHLTPGVPNVYLAHASEDHESLAKPLAERMMAEGIDVWLDDWEIRSGDSLRQKMDAGLGACTHFVVLLTPNSLGKPWVEKEIDAGFVRSVEGEAKFIGVRVGVAVQDLSPFLRTLRCPDGDLDNPKNMERLISDIHGVSRKPPRGPVPKYVESIPEGLSGWSKSAVSVAKYLVETSKNGTRLDPQTTVNEIAESMGLPEDDVRLGVLDLEESGLVERSQAIGRPDRFWPLAGLFIEFDRFFFDFDSERDAIAIANWLISNNVDAIDVPELADQFKDWSVRRMNSALNFLEGGKLVDAYHVLMEGPWAFRNLRVTDRTRRFVRDYG